MFENRTDAADRLVELLDEHHVDPEVVVAIPRGGVPIGRRVADAFGVPLVVVSVKKVSAPSNEEFAIGAVTDAGVEYVNEQAVDRLGIDEETVERQRKRAVDAARERAAQLGLDAEKTAAQVRGKRVVVVDDGLATGATARACCRHVRDLGAASHVVAVPVASPDSVADLQDEGCEVLAVETPRYFAAVGQFYESFTQVDDAEVAELLSGDGPHRRGSSAS